MSVQSYLGYLGPCLIDTSYQNNKIMIGYGTNTIDPSKSVHESHITWMTHLINADFEDGEWSVSGYEPDPHNSQRRIEFTVSPELKELVIQTILDSSFIRGKLEKWRSDAIKRLEKSVPRLQAEHEAAATRLKTLQSVKF